MPGSWSQRAPDRYQILLDLDDGVADLNVDAAPSLDGCLQNHHLVLVEAERRLDEQAPNIGLDHRFGSWLAASASEATSDRISDMGASQRP